jgi:hypothetical protein
MTGIEEKGEVKSKRVIMSYCNKYQIPVANPERSP